MDPSGGYSSLIMIILFLLGFGILGYFGYLLAKLLKSLIDFLGRR